MSKSTLSIFLKRTSVVTAVAALMSVGSVANALNGLQLDQAAKANSAIHLGEQTTDNELCKGNWVNAGCTTEPSGAGNGSVNPSPPASDPCSPPPPPESDDAMLHETYTPLFQLVGGSPGC